MAKTEIVIHVHQSQQHVETAQTNTRFLPTNESLCSAENGPFNKPKLQMPIAKYASYISFNFHGLT